eukprot:GHVQ01000184.1.p1 GENE.GHVQ01000184.1~~GHVQ01000184.1.p1  ORF type:complete len:414 (+),score=49.89 GHVQ01000184.1:561-1802(+)
MADLIMHPLTPRASAGNGFPFLKLSSCASTTTSSCLPVPSHGYGTSNLSMHVSSDSFNTLSSCGGLRETEGSGHLKATTTGFECPFGMPVSVKSDLAYLETQQHSNAKRSCTRPSTPTKEPEYSLHPELSTSLETRQEQPGTVTSSNCLSELSEVIAHRNTAMTPSLDISAMCGGDSVSEVNDLRTLACSLLELMIMQQHSGSTTLHPEELPASNGNTFAIPEAAASASAETTLTGMLRSVMSEPAAAKPVFQLANGSTGEQSTQETHAINLPLSQTASSSCDSKLALLPISWNSPENSAGPTEDASPPRSETSGPKSTTDTSEPNRKKNKRKSPRSRTTRSHINVSSLSDIRCVERGCKSMSKEGVKRCEYHLEKLRVKVKKYRDRRKQLGTVNPGPSVADIKLEQVTYSES